MKTGIFTTRSVNPLHPRLGAFIEYFRERQAEYEVITAQQHRWFSRLNWISLFFFDNWSVLKLRQKVNEYDIVLLNDLKLLPLARHAKKHNRIVVYDTIDNNVELRSYSLLKKLPFLKLFSESIKKHFSHLEKKLALKYCDAVIVNSKALAGYFAGNAALLYYYSRLEKPGVRNDHEKTPALLYLGAFSPDKGSEDVLRLKKELGCCLFIFGQADASVDPSELNQPGIFTRNRISQEELASEIKKLMERYYLVGTSLIRPVHMSYATQEANKDIDYLALGIPIIGNHRLPTEDKIKAGCGIFANDHNKLAKLFADEHFRMILTANCLDYYKRNYSRDLFMTGLDSIFGKYLQTR